MCNNIFNNSFKGANRYEILYQQTFLMTFLVIRTLILPSDIAEITNFKASYVMFNLNYKVHHRVAGNLSYLGAN